MRNLLFVMLFIPSLCYADTVYPTGNEDYHSKQIITGQGSSDVMQNQMPCDKVEITQLLNRKIEVVFNCSSNSARITANLDMNANIGDTSYVTVINDIDNADGLGGGQALGACVITPNSISCHGKNIDQSWDFSYSISQ